VGRSVPQPPVPPVGSTQLFTPESSLRDPFAARTSSATSTPLPAGSSVATYTLCPSGLWTVSVGVPPVIPGWLAVPQPLVTVVSPLMQLPAPVNCVRAPVEFTAR